MYNDVYIHLYMLILASEKKNEFYLCNLRLILKMMYSLFNGILFIFNYLFFEHYRII